MQNKEKQMNGARDMIRVMQSKEDMAKTMTNSAEKYKADPKEDIKVHVGNLLLIIQS